MARKGANKDSVFRGSLDVVPSVRCGVCGATHLADSDGFFTFYGNVMIGTAGGLIEDNFDEKGHLVNASIRCRKVECMEDILAKIPEINLFNKMPGTDGPLESPQKESKKKGKG